MWFVITHHCLCACCIVSCIIYYYTVDGGWTEWKPGYPCSATCGGGVETFYRTCTNPEPECGGKECDGQDTTLKTCDAQIPCPCKLKQNKHNIIYIKGFDYVCVNKK